MPPARSAPPSSPPRGDWLDTLRGIAASAVVFCHLNAGWTRAPSIYHSLVGHGYLGVAVFFVLSGYLIVQSALRQPQWKPFLIRRWWRIYPPYLASLAVVLLVVALRKVLTGSNDVLPLPWSPHATLATLTLLTAPVSSVATINWVYWTLSCEVAFYLVIGIGLLLAPRRCDLVVVLVTATALVAPLSWPPRFFLDWWWEFALGASLALGYASPAGWFVLAASALNGWRLGAGLPLAATLATWASILWSKRPSGAWLHRDPLFSRVGTVSYSLYLIHVPIGFYIFTRLRPAWAMASLPRHIAGDVVMFLLLLVPAWGFWRWIELPAHQFGRKAGGGRLTALKPVAAGIGPLR